MDTLAPLRELIHLVLRLAGRDDPAAELSRTPLGGLMHVRSAADTDMPWQANGH
jgi:hypothetical protein